ncbi:MAG: YbaL family putative K(+) efflux transporter [Pseudomonadota bacterium]
MEHDITLITTIASGFGMALLLGFLAVKIKMPALVGYLVAGILIGPYSPGYVADIEIASQLSEIGVMLLMFGVGLHFSLDDLLAVKRIAIPGAIVQMTIATVLGMLLASTWGWSLGTGLVFGLCLSCASTVVLLKALESRRVLTTMNGRIAVGWLIVEDLATVVMLVLLPALAGTLGGTAATPADETGSLWLTIAKTMLQVGAFIALMLIGGRRVLPWLLMQVARTGSRELFTLLVIAAAIGIAYGATALFNLSFAIGAFFAGMVMRESEFSHRAAAESLPLRDAFSVLFFVSVGMLFDPMILIESPIRLLAVVAIIVFGKSIAAAVLVIALHYPLKTAIMVASSLAQIGEFSFILGGLGVELGLLPEEGMSLVLAAALVSIALNPVLFATIDPVQRWLHKHSSLARRLEDRRSKYAELPAETETDFLEGQIVLVGYGRVGQRIGKRLEEGGISYVVIEQNRELVEKMRKAGMAAVEGDAADPAVLTQAHIADAAMMVIATPDPLNSRPMADTARKLNPKIEIMVRTHSDEELQMLRNDGIGTIFFGEEELARGMANHILERFAPAGESAS